MPSKNQLTIGLDTETELVTPGNLAPRLACTSWAYREPAYHQHPERKIEGEPLRIISGVEHHTTTDDIAIWVTGASHINDDIKLVGHNISFDMAVLATHSPWLLPYIFAAYARGNIEDTMIREQLLDIADGSFWLKRKKTGSYSLKGLAEKYLSIEMEKGEETYRLRYGELIDTPLKDWPKEAVEYSRNDAITTLAVYNAQSERSELKDGPAQARAAFALHLMSCWGVVTDGERVDEFVKVASDTMACHGEKLSRVGLMRMNGTKDLTKIRDRVKRAGGPVKHTEKGNIATDEESLIATGDPDLALLVEFSKAQKLDSVWTRYLRQGANPLTPVQARFHCLVESGRTSCSKPNLQNPHRATGLRECFIPRKGNLFIACDYSTLELCTLAQITTWLFRKSNMAEQLKNGVDLHLHFAAQMLRISYDDAVERNANRDPEVKEARQIAKAANFGYPGGMGSNSFRQYAKGFGVELTEKQAEKLREDWFKTWPEMKDYFKHVSSVVGNEKGVIEQFVSKRLRGGVQFTQACNTFFQGLASEGAKAALFEVARLCYTDPDSALFGSRPVMFIHDEIILESPADKAPEAADELAKVMQSEMKRFTPDIPIGTTVALMERWYKNAEAVRDSSGRLTVWRPDDE